MKHPARGGEGRSRKTKLQGSRQYGRSRLLHRLIGSGVEGLSDVLKNVCRCEAVVDDNETGNSKLGNESGGKETQM